MSTRTFTVTIEEADPNYDPDGELQFALTELYDDGYIGPFTITEVK